MAPITICVSNFAGFSAGRTLAETTVTTAADLVFGLGDPLQEVIHIDCQAGPKADLPADLHAYNSLLYRRFLVPVHTTVLLLRPEARHRNLTGTLQYTARPGRGGTTFQYEVIALWERPVEHFLNGPLGLVPLAVLAHLPTGLPLEQGLAGVIQRLCERLQQEALLRFALTCIRRFVSVSHLLFFMSSKPPK